MKPSTRAFIVAFSVATFLALVLVAGVRLLSGAPMELGTRRVLVLRIEGSFPDEDPNAPLNSLLGVHVVTLRDLERVLEHAASDETVAALQLRVGPLDSGWARAQEIRDAILRFRASGKPVVAFMEQGDDGTYFLASAADDIRLLPSATLWLDGISADVSFYGGTLAKVGVQADLEQIGPYKNAADVMKRSSMSDAHREAMTSLLDGLFGELTGGVAQSTGKPKEAAEELVANGPYTAKAALDAGLVHALGYADEAAKAVDARVGSELPRVRLDRYLREVPPEGGGQPVAVITCSGTIVSGESSDGLLGGKSMGADTIARAIREARQEGAKAILLRVDSPGGSATASDIIWRETQLARQAGVPVVVSMSDVAASGGYWIAMGADRVVAEPATITGSIGIYGGKYVMQGLNEKIGMTVEPVERGKNSGFMSSRAPFTDEQRAWLQQELQSTYRLFIERTATGRGFESPEKVDEIAQGRVWTGRQALGLGLVDELGGMREALAAAKKAAGIPAEAGVTLKYYPRAPTLFEMLRDGGPSALLGRAAAVRAASEIREQLPPEAREALDGAPLARLMRGGVLAWSPIHVPAR